MSITIIAIGKIKEQYLKSGIEDYKSRIEKYMPITIIELPENDSNQDKDRALKEEGKRILEKLDKRSYKIILDIKGERTDSPKLAKKIESVFTSGYNNITFIIGGSVGLSKEVKAVSNYKLSFSDLTFPHQLFRLILLEQIYRTMKIRNGEKYHK